MVCFNEIYRALLLASAVSSTVHVGCAYGVPTDPKALARLVGDAFFKEAKPPGVNKGMLAWNYGAALILDGMFESVDEFGFDDWVPKMSKYMDAYTAEQNCRGYKLAHNITMPWDSAVGDQTGLFPISFLQRALYNKDLSGADMAIANLTADHYILQWPKRLPDGTFSRTVGGDWPGETSTKVGSFVCKCTRSLRPSQRAILINQSSTASIYMHTGVLDVYWPEPYSFRGRRPNDGHSSSCAHGTVVQTCRLCCGGHASTDRFCGPPT